MVESKRMISSSKVKLQTCLYMHVPVDVNTIVLYKCLFTETLFVMIRFLFRGLTTKVFMGHFDFSSFFFSH